MLLNSNSTLRSWPDEIEKKERQTKPDYKDVAVQNSYDCGEVAVQTYESTATNITGKLQPCDNFFLEVML